MIYGEALLIGQLPLVTGRFHVPHSRLAKAGEVLREAIEAMTAGDA